MVSKHLGLSRQSVWLCISSVVSLLAQWATMMLPAVACVLVTASLPARAEEGVASNEATWVILEETDDSLCLAHGGKLITLALTDSGQHAAPAGLEVWVDRWFMQVQTADHTRHQLTAEHPSQELGCSQSIAGPQHWTLSTIKRLPEQAHP
ncbi:hypothetical protein INP77_03925 [Methylophilus sp. 13]|uniref:hypothetical protein n=1 Tax=Methylophilus sp. 13 TaxID=2781018 RepID=UPI00188DD94C|nr:hypothetical protein [Methylophilus sp. 13]MBF5038639.1 hypothetical protein [Methylophilus sp. 13]